VFGARDRVDANTAPPAVLAAIGLSPDAIAALVARRSLGPLSPNSFGFCGHLRSVRQPPAPGGNTIYTLRATARRGAAMGGPPI